MPETLRLPPRVLGQQTIAPGIDDTYFFDRYLKESPSIQKILTRSGFKGLHQVADYGCHIGGWSWQLSTLCEKVHALDINETFMDLGKLFAKENGLTNIEFKKISPATLKSLPTLDGIICLETLMFMNSTGIHEFFNFAREKLRTGGLLFLRVPNPVLLLEWLITLQRLKIDGWKAQIGWFLRYLRCLTMRKLDKPGGSWIYYCLPERIVLSLAKDYGFTVKHLPSFYKNLPETQDYNLARFDKQNWFEHYNWYLFEKGEEAGGNT